MKIVVIDGTGLIGSKLVEKLRKDGHEPVAASPETCVNTVRAEHRAAAQARHRRGVHRSDGTRASGHYESVGIGPWHDYPDLTAFTDLDVPSVDGFHKLIYKWTMIGDPDRCLSSSPITTVPSTRYRLLRRRPSASACARV
jgi:hypothetical protein